MSSHQSAGRLTRRGFLGVGGIAAVASQSVAPVLLTPDLVAAGQPASHDARYLEAAKQAARWIRGAQLGTGKRTYRDFARRVADQLISRTTDLDGKGYRWYQAWTRVKPWEVNAEAGYKIGASGIGAALVHTQLAIENRYSAILFPDNPFPRTQRT